MPRLLTVLFFCLSIGSALAQQAVPLTPPEEERAQRLFGELRCVVCQNQSIADSDADVAKDLRKIVREQIAQGATNSDVKSYLVARYGEFVLLKPSFAPHTLLLWASPILFLLLGTFWAFSRRSAGSRQGTDLSAKEQQELDKLLQG